MWTGASTGTVCRRMHPRPSRNSWLSSPVPTRPGPRNGRRRRHPPPVRPRPAIPRYNAAHPQPNRDPRADPTMPGPATPRPPMPRGRRLRRSRRIRRSRRLPNPWPAAPRAGPPFPRTLRAPLRSRDPTVPGPSPAWKPRKVLQPHLHPQPPATSRTSSSDSSKPYAEESNSQNFPNLTVPAYNAYPLGAAITTRCDRPP